MKNAKLSVICMAAMSLAACQNVSNGQSKDLWQGKQITPASLSVPESVAASGDKITYHLSKQPNDNRVKLTINNTASMPLQLHSLTIHGSDNNQCIIQAKGNYQLPANKMTTLEVVDVKTFENCVLGLNDSQSGRYQIAISHNAQFTGGVNTSTSSEPFVMTIDYSVGQIKSVGNLVGFTHYTRAI